MRNTVLFLPVPVEPYDPARSTATSTSTLDQSLVAHQLQWFRARQVTLPRCRRLCFTSLGVQSMLLVSGVNFLRQLLWQTAPLFSGACDLGCFPGGWLHIWSRCSRCGTPFFLPVPWNQLSCYWNRFLRQILFKWERKWKMPCWQMQGQRLMTLIGWCADHFNRGSYA